MTLLTSEQTAERLAVAVILGHANLRTVQRYLHFLQAMQDEAMTRFHWGRDKQEGLEGWA